MKVEVVYVAYDDTRFNSPAECKEYENRARTLMNEFNSHVLLMDMHKSLILCPGGLDLEEMITWFQIAFPNCEYININTVLSNDVITFIKHYFGFSFPENKVGLYKYDYYEDEWVSAD